MFGHCHFHVTKFWGQDSYPQGPEWLCDAHMSGSDVLGATACVGGTGSRHPIGTSRWGRGKPLEATREQGWFSLPRCTLSVSGVAHVRVTDHVGETEAVIVTLLRGKPS